jgi:hypothetical protein
MEKDTQLSEEELMILCGQRTEKESKARPSPSNEEEQECQQLVIENGVLELIKIN